MIQLLSSEPGNILGRICRLRGPRTPSKATFLQFNAACWPCEMQNELIFFFFHRTEELNECLDQKKNHLANVLILCISSYPQQGRKYKHSYFKKSALFKFVGHGIARASPWSFSLLLEPSQSFPCCLRILWDPEQNVTGNRTESLRSEEKNNLWEAIDHEINTNIKYCDILILHSVSLNTYISIYRYMCEKKNPRPQWGSHNSSKTRICVIKKKVDIHFKLLLFTRRKGMSQTHLTALHDITNEPLLSKGWTFLISPEFTDRLQAHIVAKQDIFYFLTYLRWAAPAGLRCCGWAWRSPVRFPACGCPPPRPARWCGWPPWLRTPGRRPRWRRPAARRSRTGGRGATRWPGQRLKPPAAAPGGRSRTVSCRSSPIQVEEHFLFTFPSNVSLYLFKACCGQHVNSTPTLKRVNTKDDHIQFWNG